MEKEQVANYRISKPRRVLDNTFGICAFRFRILVVSVDKVTSTTKAVVALHNCLMHGIREEAK